MNRHDVWNTLAGPALFLLLMLGVGVAMGCAVLHKDMPLPYFKPWPEY